MKYCYYRARAPLESTTYTAEKRLQVYTIWDFWKFQTVVQKDECLQRQRTRRQNSDAQTLTSSWPARPRRTCRHPGPESARSRRLCGRSLTLSRSAARWREEKHLQQAEKGEEDRWGEVDSWEYKISLWQLCKTLCFRCACGFCKEREKKIPPDNIYKVVKKSSGSSFFFGRDYDLRLSLSGGTEQKGCDKWRGDKEELINSRQKNGRKSRRQDKIWHGKNSAVNLSVAYFLIKWVSHIIGSYFFPPCDLRQRESNRHKKPEAPRWASRFRPRPTVLRPY